MVGGFAVAYGTQDQDIVARHACMSINRPVSCGQDSVLRTAATTRRHGAALNSQTSPPLHSHYNQDGYGDKQPGARLLGDERILYAIVPLFNMNKQTGATAFVPGSRQSKQTGICCRP